MTWLLIATGAVALVGIALLLGRRSLWVQFSQPSRSLVGMVMVGLGCLIADVSRIALGPEGSLGWVLGGVLLTLVGWSFAHPVVDGRRWTECALDGVLITTAVTLIVGHGLLLLTPGNATFTPTSIVPAFAAAVFNLFLVRRLQQQTISWTRRGLSFFTPTGLRLLGWAYLLTFAAFPARGWEIAGSWLLVGSYLLTLAISIAGVSGPARPRRSAEPARPTSPTLLYLLVLFAVASPLATHLLIHDTVADPAFVVLAVIGVLAIIGRQWITRAAYDRLVDETRNREEHFRDLALVDQVTGLPNRFSLELTLGGLRDQDASFDLLLLDVTGFSRVNDVAGHHAGDEVLRQVSARLTAVLPPADHLARMTGAQFAIIRRDTAEPASTLARVLIEQLRHPVQTDAQAFALGGAVGIASSATASSVEELVRHADMALRSAQETSGRIDVYTEQMSLAAAALISTELEVTHALRGRHLTAVGQPEIEMATGRVVVIESLLRWRDSAGVLRAPVEMLDYALRTDQTTVIAEWMFTEAVRTLHRCSQPVPIAVNLGVDLLEETELVPSLLTILDSASVDPSLIEIEITEDQVLSAEGPVRRNLLMLQRCGVRVIVDDFGSGYSSLSSLMKLPLAGFKLDREFTATLARSRVARSMLRNLTRFADDLGLRLVAEGVETIGQHELLGELGVRIAQGYLYARPEPLDDLADLGDRRSWASAGELWQPGLPRQQPPIWS